jgi:hypothetical protein
MGNTRMVSFGIIAMAIVIGLGIFCMAVERKPLEEKGEFWKVHLYSGGKEVINYTTVGRIRQVSTRSTISFIDVLSGKEVVVSGTFMAEEF